MSRFEQIKKAFKLLRQPKFVAAAAQHRVAAAVEHLDAIRFCNAATLVDIGANKGQFSLAYRALYPDGKIIAFEPFPESASRFEQLFGHDKQVALHRVALSDAEGVAQFHVTTRRDSSSLLKPGQKQSVAFGVHGETEISVAVKRLDNVLDLSALARPIMFKIDVQGAERKVLEGCKDLDCVDFVYIELSFVELYEGQPLFDEMVKFLSSRGYSVVGVFNQTLTASFGPTQVDVLFHRPIVGTALS
jgi:FkbM family methyltransferase